MPEIHENESSLTHHIEMTLPKPERSTTIMDTTIESNLAVQAENIDIVTQIDKTPLVELVTTPGEVDSKPLQETVKETLILEPARYDDVVDVGISHEDLSTDALVDIYDRSAFVVESEEDLRAVEDREETFVENPPEIVQKRIEAYEKSAEPEEIIVLKSLTVSVENAVAQLETLSQEKAVDPEKIAEAELVIVELYDELLQQIGIADPAERQQLIKEFIKAIHAKIDHEVQVVETAEELRIIGDDEGTHEHKRNLRTRSWTQNLSKFSHHVLGKFAVGTLMRDYSLQ